MKRRTFLKSCIAAALAPLGLLKGKKPASTHTQGEEIILETDTKECIIHFNSGGEETMTVTVWGFDGEKRTELLCLPVYFSDKIRLPNEVLKYDRLLMTWDSGSVSMRHRRP